MSGLWLTSGAGEVELSLREWHMACAFGEALGWQPTGTRIDGAGPYWCGTYIDDGYHGTYISTDDARALAAALRKPTIEVFPEPTLESVAQVCAAGPVKLGRSHDRIVVPDYCYCEMVRDESHSFDDFDFARTSPWVPRPDFDSFMVFGAVRAQVHEPCWARHLETREALAQAICGYLDRHPADAGLSDPQLLRAVEREFYGGPLPIGVRRQGWGLGNARPNGGQLMLRNAAERLGYELPAPTALRQLAWQGPWWRAARILHDHDIALIAAGVEWVYQRGIAVDATFRTFGPGTDAPMAKIPTLDLDRVQTDIFGKDRDRWPGRCLAAHDPDDEMPLIAELEDEDEQDLYIADVADPWE